MDTERIDVVPGGDAELDTDAPADGDDAELIEEISIDGMCGVY